MVVVVVVVVAVVEAAAAVLATITYHHDVVGKNLERCTSSPWPSVQTGSSRHRAGRWQQRHSQRRRSSEGRGSSLCLCRTC